VNNEQQTQDGWAPNPVTDLRAVPMVDLVMDEDGAAADLRSRILDGNGRLPVAAFSAYI
jgi:hypothetical protein